MHAPHRQHRGRIDGTCEGKIVEEIGHGWLSGRMAAHGGTRRLAVAAATTLTVGKDKDLHSRHGFENKRATPSHHRNQRLGVRALTAWALGQGTPIINSKLRSLSMRFNKSCENKIMYSIIYFRNIWVSPSMAGYYMIEWFV